MGYGPAVVRLGPNYTENNINGGCVHIANVVLVRNAHLVDSVHVMSTVHIVGTVCYPHMFSFYMYLIIRH